MKKLVLATALVTLLAGNANADQSGVTLYGVVDIGVGYVNNVDGHDLVGFQNGVASMSRWGLKGTEDLGGGLNAFFKLENGFDAGSGHALQGGRMFGRGSIIGLSSETYGTVTLGRQFGTILDNLCMQTMSCLGLFFSHAGDIDNTNGAYRLNNSVKYVSPTIAGFQAEGVYAFGGVAGSFGQQSDIGVGFTYSAGPFNAAAAYEYAKNPAEAFTDGNFVSNPATPGTPVNAGAFGFVGSPASVEQYGVGATYSFGNSSLSANYARARYRDALGTSSQAVFDSYEVWGKHNFTPSLLAALGYTYTHGSLGYSAYRPHYNQLNAMLDQNLSKRTDVYIMAVYQRASAGTTAAIYNGVLAAPSSNNTQIDVLIGMRHKF